MFTVSITPAPTASFRRVGSPSVADGLAGISDKSHLFGHLYHLQVQSGCVQNLAYLASNCPLLWQLDLFCTHVESHVDRKLNLIQKFGKFSVIPLAHYLIQLNNLEFIPLKLVRLVKLSITSMRRFKYLWLHLKRDRYAYSTKRTWLWHLL